MEPRVGEKENLIMKVVDTVIYWRVRVSLIFTRSQVSTPFSGDETSNVPPIPNVLKVFLENGQTKSFKYDSNTKVKDVILSLKHKLCIQRIQHFALVLEQVKSLRRNKLTLLNPDHTIVKVGDVYSSTFITPRLDRNK
jgi:hypothetical protein